MSPLEANFQIYAILLYRLGVRKIKIFSIDPRTTS